MDYNFSFIQQGWQCPICKRVYSPTTPMCYYCGNATYYCKITNNNEYSETITIDNEKIKKVLDK